MDRRPNFGSGPRGFPNGFSEVSRFTIRNLGSPRAGFRILAWACGDSQREFQRSFGSISDSDNDIHHDLGFDSSSGLLGSRWAFPGSAGSVFLVG